MALMEEQVLWDTENACCTAPSNVIMMKRHGSLQLFLSVLLLGDINMHESIETYIQLRCLL